MVIFPTISNPTLEQFTTLTETIVTLLFCSPYFATFTDLTPLE